MHVVCSQPLATCPQDAFINRQQKQAVRIITGQKSSQSRPLSKSTLAKKKLIAFFTQPPTDMHSSASKLNLNRLRITMLDLYWWTFMIHTPPLFKVILQKTFGAIGMFNWSRHGYFLRNMASAAALNPKWSSRDSMRIHKNAHINIYFLLKWGFTACFPHNRLKQAQLANVDPCSKAE